MSITEQAHLTALTTPVDLLAAEAAASALIDALGIPRTESTAETPARWVRALQEMTRGLHEDPAAVLEKTFSAEGSTLTMITVPDVAFTSLCEHHMLPFSGTATVSYLPRPGARIVGLSKLARLVTALAARPQVQERLGDQVVEAVMDRLDAAGAGCVIRSAHTCMTGRGARALGAQMHTSHLAGVYRDDPQMRSEFLALTRP